MVTPSSARTTSSTTFAAGENASKPDAPRRPEPEGAAEDAPSTRTRVDAASSTVGRRVSEERSWGLFTS